MIRVIDDAERDFLISAYGLTTGSGIVEALTRAKGRAVDVRLIADRRTPYERNSGVPVLRMRPQIGGCWLAARVSPIS